MEYLAQDYQNSIDQTYALQQTLSETECKVQALQIEKESSQKRLEALVGVEDTLHQSY